MGVPSTYGPVVRSGFPRAGSPTGDQKRDEFIAHILDICGQTELFWLPALGDTTTTTEVSRNARVITYDATIATRKATQGSGISVDYDGTDDEADTPDVDGLSLGDGAVDQPLSIVVLCKPDVNNALMTLLAKSNSATAEEYELFLDASGHLNFALLDESATATLEARYAAAVGTDWVLLGGTANGTGGIGGLAVYTNGVSRAVTDDSSGTYVAMENTAALVHLGARYTTKERFFNGRIALTLLVGRALNQDEMWEITKAVNAFADLSL